MQKRQKERREEIIILYRELVMLLDSSKSAYHMTAASYRLFTLYVEIAECRCHRVNCHTVRTHCLTFFYGGVVGNYGYVVRPVSWGRIRGVLVVCLLYLQATEKIHHYILYFNP